MFILDPCLMLAGKMMDEFKTKDKQAGSHEYNTVQQQDYSAHIKMWEAIVIKTTIIKSGTRRGHTD